MLQIPCIHCGVRNSTEFRYVGEVGPRPDPTTTDQAEWRRYLYEKSNPAGWQTERWFHTAGCRRFLIVERNTMTNEIRAVRGANSEGETSS